MTVQMKNLFVPVLVVSMAFLFTVGLAGCSKAGKGEPVYLSMGIDARGEVYWVDGNTRRMMSSANALLDEEGPIEIRAAFSNKEHRSAVDIRLSVDVDADGNYIIQGSAESKCPAKIILIGTAQDDSDDDFIEIPVGESEVDYVGTLKRTTNPNPPPSPW